MEQYANSLSVGTSVRNFPPEPPPAQGRICEALGSISRVSDHLHQEIALLEQRLAGVLRPAGPTGSANQTKANTTPSQLAAGLEELHARLYVVLEAVQSLTARVDL